MFLKIFIAVLFLFSLVFISVSYADKPVLRKIKKDSTEKPASLKDRRLNEGLAMLEKSMERKIDNKAFSDICKRYIGLTQQYGEADRAINFFNGLAERHPHSPNALAVSGVETFGQSEIEAEAGFNQRLSLINSRINLLCSQDGHNSIPTRDKEPAINKRL